MTNTRASWLTIALFHATVQLLQTRAPQTSDADGTTDPSPIVRLRRLDFAYAQRLVLKHLDLDVLPGSTVGLIGPNGGGKTTLIRLLVGLLKPTRGELLIADRSPQQAREAQLIGYLPQHPDLNRRVPISASQFLQLAGGSAADAPQLLSLAEAMNLQDLLDEPLGQLSGGQMQRLLIAGALVNRPALLVLDEPTTGIDVASRHQFIELIQKLKQQMRLTLIMSTHDLYVLRALCDDIACLNLTLHLHHRKPGEEIPLDETTCSLRLP